MAPVMFRFKRYTRILWLPSGFGKGMYRNNLYGLGLFGAIISSIYLKLKTYFIFKKGILKGARLTKTTYLKTITPSLLLVNSCFYKKLDQLGKTFKNLTRCRVNITIKPLA